MLWFSHTTSKIFSGYRGIANGKEKRTRAESYAGFKERVEAAKVSIDLAGRKRLLRMPEVLARTGYSRPTLYRRMEAGEFPKGIPIGKRGVAWPSDVVDQHIDGLIAA